MYKKLHLSYHNYKSPSQAPHLSSPVEGCGEVYQLNTAPIDPSSERHQPWDGYTPACTLENQDECQYLPIQTANIKVHDFYEKIQIEGDKWMHMACEEARKSVQQQGGPFGAVILQLDDNSHEIIRYWVNHNQVTAVGDPTAHAEVMTIRSACHSLGVFNLGNIKKDMSRLPQPGESSHCVIYSSAEPCPMCFSAICWANIQRMFFAATRFDAAVQGVNFSDEEIYDELTKPYYQRAMNVFQCTTNNSLSAFNRWKREKKINY